MQLEGENTAVSQGRGELSRDRLFLVGLFLRPAGNIASICTTFSPPEGGLYSQVDSVRSRRLGRRRAKAPIVGDLRGFVGLTAHGRSQSSRLP